MDLSQATRVTPAPAVLRVDFGDSVCAVASEPIADQAQSEMRDECFGIKVAQIDSGSVVSREAVADGWSPDCIDGELTDAVSGNREAAVRTGVAANCESGVALVNIPPDVLAKLLPGEDVVELEKPQVAGGILYRFVKRAFDILSTALALTVLAIPMGLIALRIKLESPGPVIYSQTRVGKDGKTFNVYKFRSMYIDAEARGAQWAQGDDPRVTPFGKFMREKRIDEIPQFWNILRGDIPLRILKTCPELSAKDKGAFALPAKTSTNESKAFSQVVSCFANGLRVRRAASSNFNHVDATEVGFLAKPIFGAVCA